MIRRKKYKVDPIVSAKLNSKSKEEIPVIIRARDGDSNKLGNVINMSRRVKRNLPLVGGVACDMDANAINQLAKDPDIDYITFDSKVFALLDVATASINRNFPIEEGYNGEGVTIAVIDTGVSPHNDLVKPKNRIVGFKDFVNDKAKPYDDNGHGTHVAGIIASNGYSSNGKYAGIAPNANILAVKALDESGSGSTSDIVAAIEWVIETKDVYNTKILNLSLGTPATNPSKSDPLVNAVEEAINAGITVITAAGNSGPSKETILSPGTSPSVLTVGAVDDNKTPELSDDFIAPFSSRGPTKEGLKKPDVVAPGVDIMSLSNKKPDEYLSLSGTSMATPLVSGACALLYDKYKDLTPNQAKAMIMGSCIDLKENYESQGVGIINLERLFKEEINRVPMQKPTSKSFFGENIAVFLILLLLFHQEI
ncbi:S8 family peptidase [Thermohalobacter berrensis]|uniref:Peptidase S8 n=1 Tax=Thermohalobacter berrensis TaxID=99594 RepID=A0A419T3S0_9FIRM|nr:S8 family peptidase [Thermohalobacter berrensis]RKD32095.1 peptidase S8 [Thermohalobacter berrensis]